MNGELGYPAEPLVYGADRIEVPDGYRVEIIGSEIIVSPPQLVSHAALISKLARALQECAPSGLMMVQRMSIHDETTGQRFVPDLVAALQEALARDEWLFPVTEVPLVVEVTSPHNAEMDRVKKLRGYAQCGIPLYLLADVQDRTLAWRGMPQNGVYRRGMKVPFGEKLPLPEPFSGEIDTSEFV